MKNFLLIFFLVACPLSLATFAIARAYALPGGGSMTPDIPAGPSINLNWNDVLNNLSSPFQNFSQSLQSAANTPIGNFNFSTSGVPESVSAGAQNLWNRFDAWLFGIAGFHIAAVFNFIFQAIGWILGFVKVAIDWLASLVH